MNVGSGINVGLGRFGKNNKHRVQNDSRGGKISSFTKTTICIDFLVN